MALSDLSITSATGAARTRRAPPDNQQVFKDSRGPRLLCAKGEWAVGPAYRSST
jgi:hypothetical protein